MESVPAHWPAWWHVIAGDKSDSDSKSGVRNNHCIERTFLDDIFKSDLPHNELQETFLNAWIHLIPAVYTQRPPVANQWNTKLWFCQQPDSEEHVRNKGHWFHLNTLLPSQTVAAVWSYSTFHEFLPKLNQLNCPASSGSFMKCRTESTDK